MLSKHKEALKDCPKWLPTNLHYEVIMGSYAYGVNTAESDKDIYGWAIPPKEYIFPQLAGYITGFGSRPQNFEQFHKCYDDTDFTIFGIVKYFQLCLENNPNMIDSLFVPANCICHMTKIGQIVRENRHKFLCKKSWHTYKGYAYSQLKKLQIKTPEPGCKRYELIEKYGFDTKFAYHVIRLIDYAEQILREGDIDLQRNKEEWKFIRQGGMSLDEIKNRFYEKEKELEAIYHTCTLPKNMREDEIKPILFQCLEEHYGSIDQYVKQDDMTVRILNDLQELINRYTR